MSEARKAFQSKAERERDAGLNRVLAVSRRDLARMLGEQAAQLGKLERMLRSIGATDPEEAAE